jgi:hypothetical protein
MNNHYFHLTQVGSAQTVRLIQDFNNHNIGKNTIHLAFLAKLTTKQLSSNSELGKILFNAKCYDLCWSMFSHKATLDLKIIEECVKKNVNYLNFALSHITGNITTMRALCEINPKCANWATGEILILTKAEASTLHSQEQGEKVYQWLTATGLRKSLKSNDVLKVSSSNTQPRPIFKI